MKSELFMCDLTQSMHLRRSVYNKAENLPTLLSILNLDTKQKHQSFHQCRKEQMKIAGK